MKIRGKGAALGFTALLLAAPAVPARDTAFPVASQVIVNGKTVAHALQIDDGTTYVPLRAVTEALGIGVKFDRPHHKITLTLPKPKLLAAPPPPPAPETVETPPPAPAPAPPTLVTPQEALKGIGTVRLAPVMISATPDTLALLQKQQVTTDQLQADLAAQFQTAGISIGDAASAASGAPMLMTEITTVRSPSRLLTSYYIHISLREAARLERDDTVAENGITWQTGLIGYAADSNIASLRDSVKAQAAEFIKDYLAANPKQTGT